jgi:hypothetical protein
MQTKQFMQINLIRKHIYNSYVIFNFKAYNNPTAKFYIAV